MTRSILLGFLTTAIISITLTEAIAIGDKEVAVEQKGKIDLNSVCTSTQPVNRCLSSSTSNASIVEFSSELPLQNVARFFLSGSMFKGCQSKLKQSKVLAQNITQKSGQNLNHWECVFSWQNFSKDKINIQEKSQDLISINNANNLALSNNSPQPIPLEKTSQEFPKLSRSSLIVSFPTADSTFKPKNTKLANPAPKTKRIASPFGWRKRPYSYQLQFHQGVDYGAPLGSPVVAVGDGIVTRVVSGCYDFGNLYCGGQLGNWIEIDHGNGTIGTYGHLKNNSIAVKEGMKVWKNQEIAQVGSSGWSTGAHLDFRLQIDGEYEDPAKHLNPPKLASKL